jgi:hypothetical protein
MSLYKERENYLKAMCAGHPVVLHSAARADGSLRKSFFRINDEEELTAEMFNAMDFPCVAQMQFDGRLHDNGKGLIDIRHRITNTWWFLQKVEVNDGGDDNGRVDRMSDAYDLTFAIMEDFIRSMVAEYEANGSCGIFTAFDLDRISWQRLSPVEDYCVGWEMTFDDEVEADRITGGSPTDVGDIDISNTAVEPEIIHFTNESVKQVLWTAIRKQKYGSMPTVQVYILVDGKYQLSTVQPVLDVPPPNFSRMDFDFGGSSTGFILIK